MMMARKDKPESEWTAVLMKGGREKTVQWVKKCLAEKYRVSVGGLMIMLGMLEERRVVLSRETLKFKED